MISAKKIGHHMARIELCSQGRPYLMTDEARPHFGVDQMRRQSYGEDLVDAMPTRR
jgi:hypothetical protein